MSNLFSTTSSRQHERNLHNPALCEELRIRDILDGVGVMTSGTFVAAYELSGIHSYYHTEDMRNRAKESLEAVLRSLPERSVRLHVRFEIRQDTGSVIGRYISCARNTNAVLGAIDEERRSKWQEKEWRNTWPAIATVSASSVPEDRTSRTGFSLSGLGFACAKFKTDRLKPVLPNA